ncbi:MAG TPA: SpoIIE family protein phosphatase [Pseudonocardia sp.]
MVANPAGSVVELNTAAAELFPGAAPGSDLGESLPAWLTEAHRRLTSGNAGQEPTPELRGAVGERTYEAHPTRGERGVVVWWLVDDTDRRVAQDALDTERRRTEFLARASNVLLSSLNVERCMEATAGLAAQHLADASVVIAPAVGHRLPISCSGPDGNVEHRMIDADPEAVPGLSEALQGFPPVPSRWIDPVAVPSWALPEGFRGSVGSVVVTPLPGHGVPAGALILLRRSNGTVFSDSEELFARLFAARVGAALSAARLYAEQASITQTLMRDLLPPRLHQVHGVEFAGGYRASEQSEQVGGDFYDVHPGESVDDETLVVLGDVCGKGLEAAVLTGKIRNTLQALAPMVSDHHRLLNLLNRALLSSHHTRFATLILASVVRSGTGVKLRLTSAGHLPPLIVRADGRVEEVVTRGTLVGALPEVETNTVEAELAPSETCLLYTDGIPEARGGPLGDDMFGESRVQTALAECAGMPAEAVVERIHMLASQWVGDGDRDDMALVAITAPRSAHLSAVNGHTRGRYTA